jgi:DNA-binding CsgD family transcriptional regulator
VGNSPRPAVRGELAAARGDFDTAKECLSEAYAALGPDRRQGGHPMARLAAEIALWEGRVDEARQAVALVIDLAEARGDTTSAWMLLTTAARVEAYARGRARFLAEGEAGTDLVDALRRAAGGLATHTPPWRAYAEQFAAELDSSEGVSGRWPEVVAAWEAAGQPYPASYACLRAAEAAVTGGDRAGAQVWLGRAAAGADKLGARPLQSEIQALARRARLDVRTASETPGPPSETERLGLTDREAEVLQLVTAGRSNSEIGAELFISAKTASVHVSRILAKLGVGSRGEAAALAHRLRLFETGRLPP